MISGTPGEDNETEPECTHLYSSHVSARVFDVRPGWNINVNQCLCRSSFHVLRSCKPFGGDTIITLTDR